ncbi:phage portal protein [Marinobacter qingdaonensis]|uniref:Phage portal protein n=1 Tax=Marinobacter qingdaonensis TaxID=3108486 RepID=A0ABU5NUP2_9GAMM|nr:phage portal protein [Marinobacter sp. ASW11-75]MEA1079519.1 phage portal protein [Marinobacter sp. ASW11-75]
MSHEDMEKRNMASSVDTHFSAMPRASWTDFTVNKSVKEGMHASGWVYVAVSKIAAAVASAPLVVFNKDGQVEWNHPITKLLDKPHPELSRIELTKLLVAWLQLGGAGYFQKVKSSRGITKELWPVSPDRIAPVGSKSHSGLISGYEIYEAGQRKTSSDYTTDTVIRVCMQDPADPLRGLSPLRAAAKAVDLDVEQANWNKSLMQNRGNPDIAISVKGQLDDTQKKSILKSILSKFRGSKNAGMPLVFGQEASITKLGLNQQEMDFLNSRRWNRDEILGIFGVPPQLAGAQESSTYNNYAESKRIFWQDTILPLINLIVDALNNSLRSELQDGYYIGADLSNIEALRESQDAKIERADKLFQMGVPMKTINERLELGLQEYPGWEIPFGGKELLNDGVFQSTESRSSKKSQDTDVLTRREAFQKQYQLVTREAAKKNSEAEAERREAYASSVMAPLFEKILSTQLESLTADETALGSISKTDIVEKLVASASDDLTEIEALLAEAGRISAEAVVMPKRSDIQLRSDPFVYEQILTKIQEETLIATELAMINATSLVAVMKEVQQSREARETVQQLKERLSSNYTFSPARSLAIARTMTGTASSMGQEVAAREAGATFKIWDTSIFDSRDWHRARDGERVGIDERFSTQAGGSPRYPCDHETTAADRVNCRCSMSFE